MRRFVVLGAAALFAFVLAAADASAATIYSQSNILRGPDVGSNCAGGSRGTCKISEIAAVGVSSLQSDNVRVQCSLKGAQPNTTFQVFWVCTNTARGCHNQSCGFITLGVVATDGVGRGKFTATKGNNPFVGKYVHLDICPGNSTGCTASPLYAAVYGAIPIGVGAAVGADSAQAGDPSGQ